MVERLLIVAIRQFFVDGFLCSFPAGAVKRRFRLFSLYKLLSLIFSAPRYEVKGCFCGLPGRAHRDDDQN